jgi:hypothetical protein
MYVRARDDAGLSSLEPIVRSFVWNRDPKTYFFNPEAAPGSPDSMEVFFVSTTGVAGEYLPHAAGDTLALTNGGATIRAYVRATDPDPPYQVVAYEARLIRESGFWSNMNGTQIFDSDSDPSDPHFSGDYLLLARSQDAHGRWDGTPDTLPFFINFPPRWVGEWRTDDQSMQQRPWPGRQYKASGRDTMRVRFAAYDPDFSGLQAYAGVELLFKFDSYPVPGGHVGTEALYYREPLLGIKAGSNYYWDMPVSLWFGGQFIPGEYTLRLQVRETFSADEYQARYGSRTHETTVHFTLGS